MTECDGKLDDNINPEMMDLANQAQAEIKLEAACSSLGEMYDHAPTGLSEEQYRRIMAGLTEVCPELAVNVMLNAYMDEDLTDDEIAEVMGMSIEEVWSWKKAQADYDETLVKAGLEPRYSWG